MVFNAKNILVFAVLISASQAVQRTRIDLSQQKLGHFEGDIDMFEGRNGILTSQKWTNGIIPYELFEKDYSQEYKNLLQAAMSEIERYTCVRFRPRTNEANYIVVYKGKGCSSPVGMMGGAQYVSLADFANGASCWDHGTIVHELLHSVGLWHEQSRFDRDNFILIHLENILNGTQFNFDMKSANETSTYGVPYSYDSVMHYAKDAFSKNGEVTIETIDLDAQERIGNREHGVDSDYEKVRKIYGCSGSYPSIPAPPVKPPPPCEDKITYCDQQKIDCQSAAWMKDYCRKTCGFCVPGCKDEITYCREYRKDCGKLDWLKTHCRRTCKFCAPY